MASLQRRSLLITLVLLWASGVTAAAGAVAPPSAEWLQAEVSTLAAPAMDGRRSGTPGGDRAARYLADRLAEFGLRPGGDSGTHLQSFTVGETVRAASRSVLAVAGGAPLDLVIGRDWMPHGGALEVDLSAPIVLAGHGIVAPEQGLDDYAGLDVRGRIVLVRGGAPAHLSASGSSRLDRLIAARERGAAALLVVEDTLPPPGATATRVGLPSASVTSAAAAALAAGRAARLRIALEREEIRAANVVGVLPGTSLDIKGEAVVIGAHYDHLGRVNGVLHPGADDNASGTALALGLARAFTAAGGARRTLVFALFAGEELGLLGSRHYLRHPAVPLAATVAMLNFDMVGRLGGGRLRVGGADTGGGLRDLVGAAMRAAGVEPALEGAPWTPSDHLRFYTGGAPVLFFHTGPHADYHRPSDTADKIDDAGLARIAAAAVGVVERLDREARPSYVRLAPPERAGGGARGAFFGIMADGRGEGDGVRVGGVVPGSAAAQAGMTEGDVIVRFDGVSVASFDELRGIVRARRPGDRVAVVFVRDGEARLGRGTLAARP